MLFLVRHAKAGSRSDDHPDDNLRPLSKAGRRQAAAIADSLSAAGAAGAVVSSPFTRCVETVQPLADRLGIAVAVDHRLAEQQPFLGVIEMLAALPDGAVLCSHGDMIPDVIAALERRGCEIVAEPNWKKGSVWAVERDSGERFLSATSWPPPAT